jgi:hypothetical protein
VCVYLRYGLEWDLCLSDFEVVDLPHIEHLAKQSSIMNPTNLFLYALLNSLQLLEDLPSRILIARLLFPN